MANRFVESIMDGSIGSVEELKAAYKTAAKKTHPDLADGAGHEAFLRLRAEYERALRELGRAAPAQDGGTASGTRGSAGTSPDAEAAGGRADNFSGGDPLAALEFFLKRGFPKVPRHQKEILRYTYARIRARSALAAIASELPSLFDAMEKELLAGLDEKPLAAETAVELLESYLKARRSGARELMAAFRMEIGKTFPPIALAPESLSGGETGNRAGPAAAAFFRALMGSQLP